MFEILSVRGLRKKRAGFELIVESLKLSEGEKIAIVGPNGSGKSTLLEILAGFILPDEGQVLVCGYSPSQALKRGLIGYSFQELSLPPLLRVSEVLELVQIGKRSKIDENLIKALLIDEFYSKLVDKLSGGMKRALSIITAFIGSKLVLLDEPLAFLDDKRQKGLLEYLRSLKSEKGVIATIPTELVETITGVFDKVYYVRSGRLEVH